MKKQLLNLGAVCIALAISGTVMGQETLNYSVKNTESAMTIDGVAEEAWEAYAVEAVARQYTGEAPTLSEAQFQAAWDDNGIYVIVSVVDDLWFPLWLSGANGWESDHVELYFDVSDPLVDGGGPADATQRAAGNYQVAPDMINAQSEAATTDATSATPGVVHANTFDEVGTYCREYFVPFSGILQAGTAIDPYSMTTIGFDISIADRDAAAGGSRQRMVWCNDASVTSESWNTCDAVGRFNFVVGVKEQVANTNILKSNVVKNEIVFNTNVSNVKVMNTMGQVVKTNENVSDLANGVYIVTATTDKGVVANRFVKQ